MSEKADVDIRRQLAISLREIESRLSRDPLNVGEIYKSSGPIREYLGVLGFLAFDFAVHVSEKLVCVRECRALSGRGLD